MDERTIVISLPSDSFSLIDLPLDVLRELASFNGLIIVRLRDGYVLYFSGNDVEKAIRFREGGSG